MNMQLGIARAIGSACEWGLRHVFRRPAANFPGKAGLYADPHLIADLRPRLREGAIAVIGTNGKTTVTNLIADALEAAGKKVACNRTGANLDSGVATALMHGKEADWGVLESDELWFSRIAPELRPDYVVLLNLFRDQLDRMGEIALIQERIAEALRSVPAATLVYNADDPLCQAIAGSVGNRAIAFGIGKGQDGAPEALSDASICPRCAAMLDYSWRQYGQLGNFSCPECGFARTEPAYTATDINTGYGGTRLTLRGGALDLQLDEPFSGTYMVYNLLAAYAAADLCQVPFAAFEQAARLFDPRNGRLQRYEIEGASVLLNLAKNPTGFNQNLEIVMSGAGPAAVAFFVNDREADGHDVSWLWDVDFERLAASDGLVAFAGGLRRNDVQVRLKHAGLDARLVGGARDFLERARAANPDTTCYLIANYTALPAVKDELDRLEGGWGAPRAVAGAGTRGGAARTPARPPSGEGRPGRATAPGARAASSPGMRGAHGTCAGKLRIVHLYPQLLNLYGDRGNVAVLANRARWRGFDVEVVGTSPGERIDLSGADLVFLGGGPDREQGLASRELTAQAGVLRSYIADDGVLLAICGGFQILGHEWIMGGESIPGLGILDAVTKRADGNARNRLVGDIALESPLSGMPVVGYENHAGRTYLGGGCQPFGTVIGKRGYGNNGADGADGARYRNVVGTYLHGPLLAKNPEVADWLLERALERRAAREGRPLPSLAPLDDAAERAANEYLRSRM